MSARAISPARLRLVRPDEFGAPVPAAAPPATVASGARAPSAVSSGSLSPTDPRWVLAVRVAYSLEGGRAAVLRPSNRRHLRQLAGYLGLRPFDANLIIAIVQDAARTGDVSSARLRLGKEVADRLELIRGPLADAGTRAESPWRLLVMAASLAAVLVVVAIRWVTSP